MLPIPGVNRGVMLQIVLVLYKQTALESSSFVSLQNALSERPELRDWVKVLLYDNSPTVQPALDRTFACEYVHNAGNGGLLAAYTEGLAQATQEHIPWILLLDQDSHFSSEFLLELLSLTTRVSSDDSVAAIVPRLCFNGSCISPARVRYGRSSVPIPTFTGVAPFKVTALNSGSAFRSAFLQHIGGFNPRFWLDFVDIWLFHEINSRGYKVVVSGSTLDHRLAGADRDQIMPLDRFAAAKNAESLFVDLYLGPMERFLYDLRLLWEYVRQKRTRAYRPRAQVTIALLGRRLSSQRSNRIRNLQAGNLRGEFARVNLI
jgi:GT2 family glycosyltransferase